MAPTPSKPAPAAASAATAAVAASAAVTLSTVAITPAAASETATASAPKAPSTVAAALSTPAKPAPTAPATPSTPSTPSVAPTAAPAAPSTPVRKPQPPHTSNDAELNKAMAIPPTATTIPVTNCLKQGQMIMASSRTARPFRVHCIGGHCGILCAMNGTLRIGGVLSGFAKSGQSKYQCETTAQAKTRTMSGASTLERK
mmetsp:Transcript_123911/g.241370  ORF Transcript_123911/g.241370 Transcript_123911/m.241370 type:complete len:200 (-) Transcript_123911:1403-2002(-)